MVGELSLLGAFFTLLDVAVLQLLILFSLKKVVDTFLAKQIFAWFCIFYKIYTSNSFASIYYVLHTAMALTVFPLEK